MEPDIQRYLDAVESQHKTKPRYMATLTRLLEKVDGVHGVLKEMPKAFHVYDATGDQLDAIGERVGVPRSFPALNIPTDTVYLDDEMYRKVILMKIVQNQWDGTRGTFGDVWDATLGSLLNASYVDNQDMTMDIRILGRLEPILAELISQGYVVPKPMGVGCTINVIAVSESAATIYAATAPVTAYGVAHATAYNYRT